MTYLEFHLVFLVPPILLLLLIAGSSPVTRAADTRSPFWAVGVICLIALTYTTPWDNYLVARRIWWYGPERVLATLGYVPIEEYLFFLLQPLLVGLFTYVYLARWEAPRPRPGPRVAWIGTIALGGLAALGGVLLAGGNRNATYLALILAWAPPLLATMWLYDGELLWQFRSTLLTATGLPTLYLWIADAIAIHQNIWTIAPEYTVGVTVLGLPLEEATFFLFTNMLVVQGLILLLYGSAEPSHHQPASRAA